MIRLAAAMLASSLAFVAEGGTAQNDDTLEWLNDYDEALTLAKKTGKPIFLEFRCAP